jgi:hypothetical protein
MLGVDEDDRFTFTECVMLAVDEDDRFTFTEWVMLGVEKMIGLHLQNVLC